MSSSVAAAGMTIILRSSDNYSFEVNELMSGPSKVIKKKFENNDLSKIHFTEVKGDIIRKVVECWKRHLDTASSPQELNDFDADFVKVDGHILFKLFNIMKNLISQVIYAKLHTPEGKKISIHEYSKIFKIPPEKAERREK